MKKAPDKYYQTIKTSLKSVVKHETTIVKLNDIVLQAHKIVIHTLHFLKLYLIHHYDTNTRTLPVITEKLILNVMKIMSQSTNRGRKPKEETVQLKNQLNQFFKKYYQPIMKDTDLSYCRMDQILKYLTTDILTVYETNIKQHYVEYVERFVNVSFDKKGHLERIKSDYKDEEAKNKKNEFCQQLRKVKTDLLNDTQKSDPIYHKWLQENKSKIVPTKKFKKDSLYYDLQCHPQDYLPYMFYMMREVESKGETIYNLFPLRSNIVPKHIRFDTASLVKILIEKKYGQKSFYLTKGNLVRHQDRLWNFFFNTKMRCFHNNSKLPFRFNYMIETDGVSCSILLVKTEMFGKRFKTPKVKDKRELYLDDLNDFSELQDRVTVGIDPNLSDLIFCTDGEKTFRYTQNQRRKETKSKKYNRIILKNKRGITIKGKTVEEWETELSNYNRKTLDFNTFLQYLEKKNSVNYLIMDFYQKFIYRKLKLNGYINRQKSESRMINRFKKIFGNPEEVVIGIGDFEQKKHRQFKEPVKGKGFRSLFRKSGFLVYLIYEFGTSKYCNKCHGECETFRKRANPRPWKDGDITVHGLLKCKTCSGLWNRDVNASRNMVKIMDSTISGQGRPKYLCRKEKPVSGAPSVSTQPN